jgi:putative membrane protein
VGLFTLPWLLMNLLTRVQAPPQNETGRPGLDARSVGVGGAAGVLGGAFAAFVPGVTGGVGGMLAGHALAIRDSRAFLVSQGASRSVYMSGALLLFFLPDGALTRGGAAAMLPVLHGAAGTLGYASAAAALAFSAAAACLLLRPITRGAVTVLERVGCRPLSWTALAGAVTLVLGLTGVAGLFVAAVATAIGLVPVLHGSRRMNALGVILLPLALNLSGVGPDVARFLGLAPAGR